MRHSYRAVLVLALSVIFAFNNAAFIVAAVQATDTNPPGANGTVKIHEYPEHKNDAEMANDPKVCQFEIHGFNFDSGQTGRWWIQEHKWGNGDESKAVLRGTYRADANGDWLSLIHI